MRFHEWVTQFDYHKRAGSIPAGVTLRQFSDAAMAQNKAAGRADRITYGAMYLMDQAWVEARRPYYSIWPGISDAFLRMKLDVPAGVLVPPIDAPLLVRFADSPGATHGLQAFLMLVHHREQDGRPTAFLSLCGRFSDTPGTTYPVVLRLPDDDTIERLFQDVERRSSGTGWRDEDARQAGYKRDELMARVAVAVCLMGSDPAFLEPDVLEADRCKWRETHDLRLVEKAHRRGKIGWVVGRGTEVSPHHRRRHLAIRWTEKGRAVPRLVWVKECIVKRRKALAMPEGYLG